MGRSYIAYYTAFARRIGELNSPTVHQSIRKTLAAIQSILILRCVLHINFFRKT